MNPWSALSDESISRGFALLGALSDPCRADHYAAVQSIAPESDVWSSELSHFFLMLILHGHPSSSDYQRELCCYIANTSILPNFEGIGPELQELYVKTMQTAASERGVVAAGISLARVVKACPAIVAEVAGPAAARPAEALLRVTLPVLAAPAALAQTALVDGVGAHQATASLRAFLAESQQEDLHAVDDAAAVGLAVSERERRQIPESGNPALLESALWLLALLCEGFSEQLAPEHIQDLAVWAIVLLQHPHAHEGLVSTRARRNALRILDELVWPMPPTLLLMLDVVMEALAAAASDPEVSVRALVFHILMNIATAHADLVAQSLHAFAALALQGLGDASPLVRARAAEFWVAMLEHGVDDLEELGEDILEPISPETDVRSLPAWRQLTELDGFLQQLVPALMANCAWDPEDLLQRHTDAQSEASGEKDVVVRPRLFRTRREREAAKAASDARRLARNLSSGGGGGGGGGGDNDDDDGDDDHESGSEEVQQWTLRRFATVAICNLAALFPAQVLPIVQAELQTRLSSEDPWVLESAMVVCGNLPSVAPSIFEVAADLFPLFLQMESSAASAIAGGSQELILTELRATCCWCLAAFAPWIAEQHYRIREEEQATQQTEGETPLHESLAVVFRCIHDPDPRVQNMGVTSLGTFAQEAGGRVLAPLLRTLMEGAVHCLRHSPSLRNRLALMDSLSVLAESLSECDDTAPTGNPLSHRYLCRDLEGGLLPAVMDLFAEVSPEDGRRDEDPTMLAVLEALASIVPAVGMEFQEYVLPLFSRCMQVIGNTLMEHEAASEKSELLLRQLQQQQSTTSVLVVEDPFQHVPSMYFVVACLDALSALAGVFGGSFSELLVATNSSVDLFGMLHTCLVEPTEEVRQAALSLLGELFRHGVFGHDEQMLRTTILPLVVRNVDVAFPSVTANACWAFGELVSAEGGAALGAPFVENMVARICIAYDTTANLRPSVTSNMALCIGHCASMAVPATDESSHAQVPMALCVGRFAPNWLNAVLRSSLPMRDQAEKTQTIMGVLAALHALEADGLSLAARHMDMLLASALSWLLPSFQQFRGQPLLGVVVGTETEGGEGATDEDVDELAEQLPAIVQESMAELFRAAAAAFPAVWARASAALPAEARSALRRVYGV